MRTLLFSALLPLSGCAHSLHEVQVGGVSPGVELGGARLVEGRAEQFVIFGFVYDTNYVDAARQKLIDSCPGKRIEGLTTQYSTDLGFFSWTNRVAMKGFCVAADAGRKI